MKYISVAAILLFLKCLVGCVGEERSDVTYTSDSLEVVDSPEVKALIQPTRDSGRIDTKNQDPAAIVAFAKTLIGVPYKYGSTDPGEGFDCSGFITYVFNHFDIQVPRSSIDFTHVGVPVERSFSRPGDLILFTGTDSLETHVGHMGIVTENTDTLRFIHSTSGKKYGVTITALNEYYLRRFVKVIRLF